MEKKNSEGCGSMVRTAMNEELTSNKDAETSEDPVSFEDVFDKEYYARKNAIIEEPFVDRFGSNIPSSKRGGLAGVIATEREIKGY